jgi:phosphoribosylanthranilate isomerase
MVRIKLCGVTRLDDALRAVELGIDVIGFNFVSDSPRRIEPQRAQSIAARLPAFVLRVGVFADEPHASLCDTARTARIHCIQFHGDEAPEECAAAPLPWYKAHRPGPGFDLAELQRFDSATSLLDACRHGLRGGTGRTGDWDVARRASAVRRVILAGGLNPDNIAAAVRTVRPYAVDVNSGVETAPGHKDGELLARLVAQVAAAAGEGGRVT